MALKFQSGDWRFQGSPGTITPEFNQAIFSFIIKIADTASDRWAVLEEFKGAFATASGSSSNGSSAESWAETDLGKYMDLAMENAATYLDAFWTATEAARVMGADCPSLGAINQLIEQHSLPYRIAPPHLTLRSATTLGDSANLDNKGTQFSNLFQHIERHEPPLGQGGFGTVYRASLRTHIGTKVYALKILDPSAFVKNTHKALQRFHREAAALAEIQHRGIVEYVDAGVDDEDRPCILMAYVQGQDIKTAASRLQIFEKCELLAEILSAISYAHSREPPIVHRDLKPSNILVRESDRQPVIVDFGSAYLLDETSQVSITTRTGVGTPGYIAPYVSGNPSNRTHKQDFYSLGVILYELIAGHRPSDPRDFRPLSSISPDLAPLDPVISRALAVESSTFSDAGEFRRALLNAVKSMIDDVDIPF